MFRVVLMYVILVIGSGSFRFRAKAAHQDVPTVPHLLVPNQKISRIGSENAVIDSWQSVVSQRIQQDGRLRFSAKAVDEFAQSIEAVVGCSVPLWWKDGFRHWYSRNGRDWNRDPSTLTRFGLPINLDEILLSKCEYFSVDLEGKGYELPIAIARNAVRLYGNRIDLLDISDDRFCVAIYTNPAVDYQIYCIDRGSRAIIWENRVNAYMRADSVGVSPGMALHSVEIVSSKEQIVVFGDQQPFAYLSAFDVGDGHVKYSYHFCVE